MSKNEAITTLANATACQFTRGERCDNAGDAIYHRRADAPEWVQDMCHRVHGDSLPNDWVYKLIVRVLDNIAGMSDPHDYDERHEVCDSMVDIATHQLNAWASDGHSHHIDQANQEFGIDPNAAHDKRLQIGQFHHICEIFDDVLDVLTERAQETIEGEAETIANLFDELQAKAQQVLDQIDEDEYPEAHAFACSLQEQAESMSDAESIVDAEGW